MLYIAIDIGGTQIKSALIDHKGHMFEHQTYDTPNNIDTHITDVVLQIVKNYKQNHTLSPLKVGIATAGVVDEEHGTITFAGPTIPNYIGTNFKALLAPYDADVHVYNDVNAALLGEREQHTYTENNMFFLTLGTGIGGAFYSHDTGVYVGQHYRANDIGYLLYQPSTQTYYEQRAATSALMKRMANVLESTYDNAAVYFQIAEDGHAGARQCLHDWGQDVAEGLAQIQLIYDPACIVIGGGVSAQQSRLLQYIVPHIAQFLPNGYAHAPILTAKSKNFAALYGAVSQFKK